MKLIIDTNIIFSGIIKDSVTRKILIHPDFEFYTPDFFLLELKKYQDYLRKKTKRDKKEFNLKFLLFQDI
jgi:predicted nucleic acid-binding protein